jgi:hypothetical protein
MTSIFRHLHGQGLGALDSVILIRCSHLWAPSILQPGKDPPGSSRNVATSVVPQRPRLGRWVYHSSVQAAEAGYLRISVVMSCQIRSPGTITGSPGEAMGPMRPPGGMFSVLHSSHRYVQSPPEPSL